MNYPKYTGLLLAVAIGLSFQPITRAFVLTVDPTTGEGTMQNESEISIDFDVYKIFSPSGSLLTTWNSLQDQGASGGLWLETKPNANFLSEVMIFGFTTLDKNEGFHLGTLFNVGSAQDLTFQFLPSGSEPLFDGDVVYGSLPTNVIDPDAIIPEPTAILVDIKPGSFPNSVNLKSKGVLPIAILSTEEFDATQVKFDTLMFGDPLLIDNGGTAVSPLRSALEDVSGDGLLDLTLKFSVAEMVKHGALVPDTLDGILIGLLVDGTSITGMDSIRIVPPNGSNGNSLQTSAVPEPTTSALALVALCLAIGRRHSR